MSEGIQSLVSEGAAKGDSARLVQVVRQLNSQTSVKGVRSMIPNPIQDSERLALSNKAENKGQRIDVFASVLYAMPALYAMAYFLQ